MNLEEFKKIWDRTENRLSALEAETARLAQSASKRRNTVLDNLRNRYGRFSIVATVMITVMLLYGVKELLPGPYSLWISIAMAIYFLVAAIMDFSLYRRLGKVNIDTMSVSEVCRIVMSCRRLHFQFMAILIPSAILLLGVLVWQASDDVYMLVGMVSGALIGLAVGLNSYRKFMADYRFLISD